MCTYLPVVWTFHLPLDLLSPSPPPPHVAGELTGELCVLKSYMLTPYNPVHAYVIDPDAPITVKEISIPYYPKANDVVWVKLNTRTLLVQAKHVDHDKQCFHGHELRQVRGYSDRFNILSRTTTFNCCDVLNVVPHRCIAGYVYIDSN